MKRITLSETPTSKQPQLGREYWPDEASIRDIDNFIMTLSNFKAKGVPPELLSSIITHYASKWIPELSEGRNQHVITLEEDQASSLENMTNKWRKKRFLVETIIGILPLESQAITCNFLLRLLRVANMLRVDSNYKEELEKRVAWLLDQASLKELMIPSFSHTCGTLLDIDLVRRLVRMFMGLNMGSRSGGAMVRVAKLLDCYLAEIAIDSKLKLEEFIELANALPSHARATDDGLYRAIDTYLKAHPGITKKERKLLCRSMNTQKLTGEASLHAAQNERLPIRTSLQLLYSDHQNRIINKQLGSSARNFNEPTNMCAIEHSARCSSIREISTHQTEIKRLKEDVVRLQRQIDSLQAQLDKVVVEKKKGLFKWMKMGSITFLKSGNETTRRSEEVGNARHASFDQFDPGKSKVAKGNNNKVLPRWRWSLS